VPQLLVVPGVVGARARTLLRLSGPTEGRSRSQGAPRRPRRRRRGPDQPQRERQISPSVDVVVKLTEAFDIATDYLLVEGAARRPFRAPTDLLGERGAHLGQISDDDRAALIHIIDGLPANSRIHATLGTAS